MTFFDFSPTVHPPSYVICSNYSYRQNIGSCLCSHFKNHKFLVYSMYERRFPQALGCEDFTSTNVPIVIFLNRVLRPSNEKSTVIGNITHEWPRFCLKGRQRSVNSFPEFKGITRKLFIFLVNKDSPTKIFITNSRGPLEFMRDITVLKLERATIFGLITKWRPSDEYIQLQDMQGKNRRCFVCQPIYTELINKMDFIRT